MKKIYLYLFTAVTLSFFTVSCEKDLPFPIDQVTRSVAIDIVRIPGTDGVLSDGQTSGDYQLKLTIPTYQGDYSMMDRAQLLAVLNDGAKITSKVVVDNITEFPATLTLDVADIYSKFGKQAPSLGEIVNFTVNIVLKSGEVIPGWNQYTGIYNNQAFSGWIVDGRNFSYRVQYSVVCPFSPESTFIGTFQCSESSTYGADSYEVTLSHYTESLPSTLPPGVDPTKLYGIKIDPISPNIWEPTISHTILWLNTEDFSVLNIDQPSGDNYQGNPTTPIVWRFRDISISSCTRQIRFIGTPTISGVGNYQPITFTIKP